mmetsp:Transcript_55819/g.92948  ORF Transcript_55819/g.92948 Transcript_55819/m.92948 type:complete len:223 (-) Transcript_55819:130-798(-)
MYTAAKHAIFRFILTLKVERESVRDTKIAIQVQINLVLARFDPFMLTIHQRLKRFIIEMPPKRVTFAHITFLIRNQVAQKLRRLTHIRTVIKQERLQFRGQTRIFRLNNPHKRFVLNALIEQTLHIERNTLIVLWMSLIRCAEHHIDNHGTDTELIVFRDLHVTQQVVEEKTFLHFVPKTKDFKPLIVMQPIDDNVFNRDIRVKNKAFFFKRKFGQQRVIET